MSPTLTRMTGPGTVPPNVQTFWTKPGATVISLLGHDELDVVDVAGQRRRRRRRTDVGAFGSARRRRPAADRRGRRRHRWLAGPRRPPPRRRPSHPALSWPGIEQRKVRPCAGTSTSTDAVSPGWATSPSRPAKVMSCRRSRCLTRTIAPVRRPRRPGRWGARSPCRSLELERRPSLGGGAARAAGPAAGSRLVPRSAVRAGRTSRRARSRTRTRRWPGPVR